jgi:quercetin dioxygenase-like cupin family protein
MTTFAQTNLDEAEDMAPKYGMAERCEARFLRSDLGAAGIGLSSYKMKPGQRLGFGHRHGTMEEMYVALSGSGRFRIDDEIIEVGPKDVVYCPPEAMREWEAGPDGLEILAFGSHAEGDNESEMVQDFWTD